MKIFVSVSIHVVLCMCVSVCHYTQNNSLVHLLALQSVFISPNITIEELEDRLRNAWSVIRESRDMNPNCRGYALPSLCFSVLPVCNTPELTNHQYFAKIALYKANMASQAASTGNVGGSKRGPKKEKKHRKGNKNTKPTEPQDIFDTIAAVNRDKRSMGNKHFRNYVQEMDELSEFMYTSQLTTYESPTRNTENLQRLCKKDCELLELELCSMEYAIAKRHPTIGQKLPLEDCDELREGSICSHTGIDIEADPHQTCYWDKGTGYRGMVNVSRSGKECMKWTKIMREIADLPELAGHNFCRNPKGQESQPWCYIDKQKTIEYCNITKCAEKMWLYIIAGTLILGMSLFLIVIILCCRKCKRKGVSNIQNVRQVFVLLNSKGNNFLVFL